jgi:hypothetical protein
VVIVIPVISLTALLVSSGEMAFGKSTKTGRRRVRFSPKSRLEGIDRNLLSEDIGNENDH